MQGTVSTGVGDRRWINHLCIWRMASAMPDLWLPYHTNRLAGKDIYQMTYLCWVQLLLLFWECCSRCRFQPCDCIICFIEYIQFTLNFVIGHVSTMRFIVCRWPRLQEGDRARPHLCKLAWHGPWPVQKRFIRNHVWRGRSKPGCRIVGSVTIVWLTTEADDQSSLHCVIVSTGVMSDHIGRRDASRGGGCSKTLTYTCQFGWVSMIWSVCFKPVCVECYVKPKHSRSVDLSVLNFPL